MKSNQLNKAVVIFNEVENEISEFKIQFPTTNLDFILDLTRLELKIIEEL